MRRAPTPAEAKLWKALRDNGLAGTKVRRQVPVGAFLLDFAVLSRRLAIEVDGQSHADDPGSDARRTAWLEDHGWMVVRFSNAEVMGNLEGVLSRLLRVVNPHPDPLPTGEGAT